MVARGFTRRATRGGASATDAPGRYWHWPVAVLQVVSAGQAALLVQPQRAAVVPVAAKQRRLAPQAVEVVQVQAVPVPLGEVPQVLPVEQVPAVVQAAQRPSLPQR